jgi:hypothetical protein
MKKARLRGKAQAGFFCAGSRWRSRAAGCNL